MMHQDFPCQPKRQTAERAHHMHTPPLSLQQTRVTNRCKVACPHLSSQRDIHSPMELLPCPQGYLQVRTRADIQAEKHHEHSTAENELHLRCNKPKATLHPQQSLQDDWFHSLPFQRLQVLFNSLSKVLFTFPSWYLFAIGLKPVFSFG